MLPRRRHFCSCFRILLVHATNFPRTSSLVLSLLVETAVGVSASSDEGVGDVGEDELEVLVDKSRATIGP